MKPVLCIFLAVLRCVVAQNAFAALKGALSPPSSTTPLANAAAWHEALAIDAANNHSGTNQLLYTQFAWFQSLENSSNSYTDGSFSLAGGANVSQLLQFLQLYPTRFDQAQASDPKKTPSKYDRAEHVRNPWSDAMS